MTSPTPLVSVVVPTYNRAYILKQAIDSILQSTHPNLEVIVVDDGSTDETRALIEGLGDSRVRYVPHEKNKGVSAALCTGMRESRGEFVAICASDDQFLPEKIQKSVDALKALPPVFGMAATNHYDLFPDGSRKIGIIETDPRRMFPMPSTWLIRRQVIEDIGPFDPRLWSGEDTEFMVRFRARYKFHFLNDPLVIKYASPDNFFVNKEKLLRLRKLSADNVKGEGRLYALMLFIYAKDLWKCGERAEARKNFLKAFLNHPLRLQYLVKYAMSFVKPNEGIVWAEK